MNQHIRIAVVGYGNLGQGAVKAIRLNPDLALAGVFTRRDPRTLQLDCPVYSYADLPALAAQIDVCILCGGSATDLDQQGPAVLKHCHTVDSFDTHSRIPEYFARMDQVGRASGHAAVISVGWDPGLFSLNRVLLEAVLPDGNTTTFWGKGVSQGHSDAIRRISGVKKAVQYTIPLAAAQEAVRAGQAQQLTTRQKHIRECYVVLDVDADAEAIRQAIITMPNYFADYDTTVHFIDAATFEAEHVAMPHGGNVIRQAQSSPGMLQVAEFSLRLASNPEFTSSILVATARALHRLAAQGATGALSLLDIPLGLLSAKSPEALRKELL